MAWYSKLVSENIYGLGGQVAMLIGGIATAVVFPKLLGAANFGLFSVAFALANIWLFFTDFGINQTVYKFIPHDVKGKGRAYFTFFTKWKWVLTVIASVSLFFLADFFANGLFNDARLAIGIKVASAYVFFYSLGTYYSSVFTAAKNNKYAFIYQILYHCLRVIMPTVLLVAYFKKYEYLILGTAAAALVGLVFCALALGKVKFGRNARQTFDSKHVNKYLFYGSLGFFGTSLITWMDTIIIGAMMNATEAGFYRIGMMWVSAVGLLIPFSAMVLFAAYSEIHAYNRLKKIKALFSYSLKYGLIFAAFAVVSFMLLSEFLVKFIYGPEYIATLPILMILGFLCIEITLNSINYPLLSGTGKIGTSTLAVILTGIVSSIAMVFVAPLYGIIGVAVTAMIVRNSSSILLNFYIQRHLGLKGQWKFWLKPALAAAFTFVLLHYFVLDSVHTLEVGLIFAAGIALLYFGTLIALKGLSIEEARRIFRR